MSNEAESKVIGLRSLPRRQIVTIMVGVMLAIFLSSLDQTIVGTAMPRIISDLGGFSNYTWMTTAYIITSAIAIPITGKLTDMYGRKRFYIIGLVIFTVGSLLCGLSNTMTQIILFRGLQGIGAGIMMSNAFTVIGDLFPPAERGKYQGIVSAVFAVASVIGPLLGGFLTDNLSWHWIFFVNVPLGVFVIFLFTFRFPDIRPQGSEHRVDYAGAGILVLTVVPLLLALSWGGVEYPWSSAPIIAMLILSGVMAALLVRIEDRNPEPIIPMWLFRNRIVGMSNVAIFLTAFGMFGGIIFVPLFFQGVLAASASASGTFLTPMMLGIAAGSFISGQLISRTGGHYRIQGAIGIAVMASGMALLSRMTAETTYTTAVANVVMVGFGLGTIMPLYTIIVQNAVPYNVLGVASSSVPFMRSVGGSVGLAIFGSILNNRFASDLAGRLPAAIKSLIPPEQLAFITKNPQVLVSPESQAQLRSALEQLGPQGNAIYDQVIHAVREGLAFALSQVFLVGFLVALAAMVIHLFIPQIRLRKQHVLSDIPSRQNPTGGES
jgi:EmrB/QacA subfamily drug resistance transporter